MTELLYMPENKDELVELVPQFIRTDRNGYALACAMMHMVNGFLLAVKNAVIEMTDVEAMSESALDEKAYSLGMAWYDYGVDEARKRMWIREAELMRGSIGTVAAITRLMNGAYANCKVEEWSQYGAEPYHFRVTVFGKADPKTEKWARNAIAQTKNLRSILDGFYYSDAASRIILREKNRQAQEIYETAQEDGLTAGGDA